MIDQIKRELQQYASLEKAQILQRFFKTGPGQYGEGDIFIGVKVPEQRTVAKKYLDIPLTELKNLLHDKVHEYRLTAVIILVQKFQKTNCENQNEIVEFYLHNLPGVNNWDLVDLSAPYILGGWLAKRIEIPNFKSQIPNDPYNDKTVKHMAKSRDLWVRRIAMMSTYGLIKQGEFELALEMAEILLQDEHDLIQKVVGWMLREIGKRDLETEEVFLKKYYKEMPRTALRYAIEKFPEEKRQGYLQGKI